jgi:hypothetical protein
MVDTKIGYSWEKPFEMDSNSFEMDSNGYSWIFLSN